MNVTRREVLQAAMLTATVGSMGSVIAFSMPAAVLLVYDSRLPRSLALRARHPARAIDVAAEHATRWRGLRDWRSEGRVAGLTTWSDWVLVRGFLEEKRKRVRTEARRGELFYWEMA